jgi:predicted negative regulator of RcsB-dependent stress response
MIGHVTKKKEARAPAAPSLSFEGAAEQAFEVLKKYQSAIIAAVLLAAALLGFLLWRASENAALEEEAWKRLYEVRKDHEKWEEKLKKLPPAYAGTSAAPYIALAHAGKLVERGQRQDLEAARDILTRALARYGSIDAVKRMATQKLEAVTKELGDERTWKALQGTAAVGSPAGTK